MAKGQTHIEGIYPQWRKGIESDSFRLAVKPSNSKQIQLSAKTHPILGQINRYLKNKISDRGIKAGNRPLMTYLQFGLFSKRHCLETYRLQTAGNLLPGKPGSNSRSMKPGILQVTPVRQIRTFAAGFHRPVSTEHIPESIVCPYRFA